MPALHEVRRGSWRIYCVFWKRTAPRLGKITNDGEGPKPAFSKLMHYLVDGNNVMAQTVGWHKDKRAARKRLIRDLSEFVAVHRARIRVVFDGRPDEEFPDGTKYKSVQILYARYGSDADSRIKEIVHGASYKRDMVVVSSDRDLVSFASKQGSRTISSGKFRNMLDSAGKARTKREKPVTEDPVDVEEWLNYFENTKS